MQFQIPQFIDIEAKIVGPLTIKQFIALAASVIVSFGLFYVLQIWLWLVVTGTLVGGALAMAFVKINGQSFYLIAFSALRFYWKPKLYLWTPRRSAHDTPSKDRQSHGGTGTKKSLIESLQEKLTTSKVPIPKREKPLEKPKWQSIFGVKDKLEVLRKITGEHEVARRVDYR